MKKLLTLSLLIILASHSFAQQTVGLFFNDSTSYNGYTLFTPLSSDTTFLIDNCGELVHQWVSTRHPGASVYLLENGHLLHSAALLNPSFPAGGNGGRVEDFDWDGNLTWSYDYSNNQHSQHHDIRELPNGNVLLLAWDSHNLADAVAHGRDTTGFPDSVIWSESILEVHPVGSDSGTIVWQWNLWDHLIQDFDSTKLDYGVVADHPELLNINYLTGNIPDNPNKDWLHANGMDYNANYDQIIFSSRQLCEVYIIDHNTTTAEAASHSGGARGKGGDFLYRYGNPNAYGRGDSTDETLFGQHNPAWIPDGYLNGGQISIFNNLAGPGYSEAVIIDPPSDGNGNYDSPGAGAYGPSSYAWSYTDSAFFGAFISSVQRLPNGNTLLCQGPTGHFTEVTPTGGNVVWDYINPVGVNGPVSQGNVPANNLVFRATRYGIDYPAFDGRDLTPGLPIELNPLPSNCIIYEDSTTSAGSTLALQKVSLNYSNPIDDQLALHSSESINATIEIFNLQGQLILEKKFEGQDDRINTTSWSNGMYLMQINVKGSKSQLIKIVKQ